MKRNTDPHPLHLGLEGWITAQHGEKHAADGPDVRGHAVALKEVLDDFTKFKLLSEKSCLIVQATYFCYLIRTPRLAK